MKKLKYFLVVSLALNILAAGAAGLFIYRKGGISYLRYKAASLQSVQGGNYANYRSIFGAVHHHYKICMVGDSIVNQCRWSEYFGFPVANRGISGDRTDGLKTRLDQIIDVHPSSIYMMIGINDIQSRRPIDDIAKDYSYSVNELKKRLPGCKIIVHSVLPVNNDLFYKIHGRTVDNSEVFKLNVILKNLPNVEYIDLTKLFSDGNSLLPAFTFDGIHLNGDAYLKWVGIISSAVN